MLRRTSVYVLLALASLFLLFLFADARRFEEVEAVHQKATLKEKAAARTGEGVPNWLQHFVTNDFIYVAKILGDSYTPKTLLEKQKELIQLEETVNVSFPELPDGSRKEAHTCRLLDRAGKADGTGETVVQIWKCERFPYIIVASQRASGQIKYLWQGKLQPVHWPEVPDWDGLPASYPKLLRVRKYEDYKLEKIWTTYALGSKLSQVMNRYPDHTFFFTGASRGATLSEPMGLRFALEFRRHPSYIVPYVVSTGAYRWTNIVGRDMLGLLLPRHFAHILLGRTRYASEQDSYGELDVDFVSHWPGLSTGVVDVVPQFVLLTDSFKMQPCVPTMGCPGDISTLEVANLPDMSDRFNALHKSVAFIRAFRGDKRSIHFEQGAAPPVEDRLATLPLDQQVKTDVESLAKSGKYTTSETRFSDVWRHWKQESCDRCMGVPIFDLMNSSNVRIESRIGCLDTDDGTPVPECEVESSAEQAGGHQGDFYKLRDGLIAKRSRALDVPRTKRSTASLTEWNFYMQAWCIRELAQRAPNQVHVLDRLHVLDRFALGINPWAPRFYGLCQISQAEGDSKKFNIMENLHAQFSLPSTLDIKLGQTLEPVKPVGIRDALKYKFQSQVSSWTPTSGEGARLAGFRVWKPHRNNWRTESNVALSLEDVFDKAFKYLLNQGGDRPKLWLTQLRDKAEDLSKWWQETGIYNIRCYAASLLFVWEGDPNLADPAEPVLKLIDFAHCHALSDFPEWPDDDTAKGLSSVVLQLQRLIDE